MTKLEVVFLGTSSATPTKGRSLPAIAIRREGQVILMDCGEGAQGSFVKFGLGLNKEMLILITHLHGDHVNGLLGLLQTMSMSQRIRALTIVAPPGLFGWLKTTMDVLPHRPHVRLSASSRSRSGVVYRGKDFRVRAARANHSVDAWSYVFEELPRPGVFDPDKGQGAAASPKGRSGRASSMGGAWSWPA